MYFELSDFYKRDVNFVYSEEKNTIDWLELRTGKSFKIDKPLIYEIDKIDNYINNYDILPTIGVPLVSKKFKDTFEEITGNEVEFFGTNIIDSKGNCNSDFYALNVLSITSCMDVDKSIVEKTKYGTIKIKKLHLKTGSLGNKSITRMEEHKSYIIVTEEFKKRCEEAGLKGVEFVEEGHTIYTDI